MVFCRTKLGYQDGPQHWILLCIPRSKPIDPKMLGRSTPFTITKNRIRSDLWNHRSYIPMTQVVQSQSWTWNLLILWLKSCTWGCIKTCKWWNQLPYQPQLVFLNHQLFFPLLFKPSCVQEIPRWASNKTSQLKPTVNNRNASMGSVRLPTYVIWIEMLGFQFGFHVSSPFYKSRRLFWEPRFFESLAKCLLKVSTILTWTETEKTKGHFPRFDLDIGSKIKKLPRILHTKPWLEPNFAVEACCFWFFEIASNMKGEICLTDN